MRILIMGTLALGLCTRSLWALDDKAKAVPEKPPTAAGEYKKELEEYAKGESALRKKLVDAKAAEDRQKVVQEYRSLLKTSVTHFMALAQKYAKDPVAVDSLLWVVQHGAGQNPSAEQNQAIDLLIKDHFQDKKLSQLCLILGNGTWPKAESTLRAILDKTGDHDVKGVACFALGNYLKDKTDTRDAAKKAATAGMLKEAEALFARVLAEFGTVKAGTRTLADLTRGNLFELQNLSVGKVAPDIEGEDSDGKKFKLSDYRGKVVVLDFWAEW
jgi:hypothetical protein